MRLFYALVFLSSTALACPDLTGFYPVCQVSNGNFEEIRDAEVTQALVAGVETYEMSYTKVRDGVPVKLKFSANGLAVTETQRIPDPSVTITTVTTARCLADTLAIDSAISWNRNPMGTFKTLVTRENGKLVQKIQGRLWGQPLDSVVVCE